MNDEPYRKFHIDATFDLSPTPVNKDAKPDIKRIIADIRKEKRELHKANVERNRKRYWETPPERRPHKPKGPEFVIVQNYSGRNVRIKSKNKWKYLGREETKLKHVLTQPHNSDMSTQPNNTLDGEFKEYQSTDENLPKTLRQQKKEVADVEPWWNRKNPTLRKSWPEFCRDFIGQTYGSIAQSLLELNASDDPGLRIQFLKFIMEMGKQGNPQALQLDVNANVKSTADIYAQLTAMATAPSPGNPGTQQPSIPGSLTNPDSYEAFTGNSSTVDAQFEEAAPGADTPASDCNSDDPVRCMACPKYNDCDSPVAHYAHEMNQSK